MGGKGRLLVLEHNRADQLRVELDDDGRAVAVLGGNGECIGDDGIGREDHVLRNVAGLLGGLKGWEEDLLVDGINVLEVGDWAVMGRPRMRRELEREDWSRRLSWLVRVWILTSLAARSARRAWFSCMRDLTVVSIDFTVDSMSLIFWIEPHRRLSLAFISAIVLSMSMFLMGGDGGVGDGVWVRAWRLFLTIG